MGLLQPGETCWRVERARRAAFLVDTQAYFNAALAAMSAARRSIVLLGWGFDARTRLAPDGREGPDDPDEIGHVLLRLSRARPELDIRVQIWRSAVPISATQVFFPHQARKWFKGSGVRFLLDAQVPFGGCHHQKVLVIDDQLAFCGGGDFMPDRWDTPAHLDSEPRRIMPDHEYHPPRHEVMMMVDGPAARALGELARERWTRAEPKRPPPPAPPAEEVGLDLWPGFVRPDLTDVDVAVARTEPGWKGAREVFEIGALALRSFTAARQTIYLENQYFTSPVAAETLAARLEEPDGPEVVLISTEHSPSWFDRATMDHTRSVLIRRLQLADVFGRFRAYCPETPQGRAVIVHAKTSVIDDRIARVGSANLNNRSGGFDTECELGVELAERDEEGRAAIRRFRNRLAGHYMGRSPDEMDEAIVRHGGLIGAIEALNTAGRLRPILPEPMGPLARFIAKYHLGDPLSPRDSFRPWRRREAIERAVRAVAARRQVWKAIDGQPV
ncbi:MAG: phospholipase [Caulobacteraceae bacterium]|nr:phospholipase [Caulobacteraceae bacterium]